MLVYLQCTIEKSEYISNTIQYFFILTRDTLFIIGITSTTSFIC